MIEEQYKVTTKARELNMPIHLGKGGIFFLDKTILFTMILNTTLNQGIVCLTIDVKHSI